MSSKTIIRTELLDKTSKYVRSLLETKLAPGMTFHNYGLTEAEVASLEALLAKEPLPNDQSDLLRLAVLFRLTGYTESYDDHETSSQEIAAAFLSKQGVNEEVIHQIQSLMAATRTAAQPTNQLEEVIQDVQTAYYGQKQYRKRLGLLMEEKNRFGAIQTNLKSWYEINANYLTKHSYHTQAAKELYAKRKKKNLKKIPKALVKLNDSQKENSFSTDSTARTIFKTAIRNHIDLTNIGDQKANIMLSVNAIILTIGIPIYARYASEYRYLTVPAFIFMATCIITMIFAAYATKPSGMKGEIDMKELNAGNTDVFFFGNFYGIKQETYKQLVRTVLSDRKLMDDGLINHLYFMGQSLGNKYVYLRICYSVFIGGIILTVLAFIVSYSMVGNGTY